MRIWVIYQRRQYAYTYKMISCMDIVHYVVQPAEIVDKWLFITYVGNFLSNQRMENRSV